MFYDRCKCDMIFAHLLLRSNGLVDKALDSQSGGPLPKTTG